MCVVLAVRPLKSSLITEDARCWLGPWSVFYHHPPRRGLSTLGPPERAARTPRGRESREPVWTAKDPVRGCSGGRDSAEARPSRASCRRPFHRKRKDLSKV